MHVYVHVHLCVCVYVCVLEKNQQIQTCSDTPIIPLLGRQRQDIREPEGT